MNTDYNLYKIFLYLYEEKSISKTANKLYVSQPAISYSLKELENQLGYTLFYRNSKGIEPTEEAKELYGYISTAFNILNEAEDHLKKINNLSVGTIRIGIVNQLGVFVLTDYLTKFKKKYPGITFEIISKTTSEMLEMLENRKIDVIIDTLPITSKKNIKKIILSKLNNCFIYNKKLNNSIKIDNLEDLNKYKLILPSYNNSLRYKLDEYMESNNLKLEPLIEVDNRERILDLVKEGLGVGYVINSSLLTNNHDYEILNFNNELPVTDVCLIYLEEFATTATKKFINMLNVEKE